jgi:MioC protein
MSTVILFGTESGNAELVADDLIDEIGDDAESIDMADFELADFDPANTYIVVCSTHGEGELPSSARPFGLALDEQAPDLSGIHYSIFGLGNSSYEIYSHGSEIIDEKLTALGATRVGTYGRHDAVDGSLPNDEALEWLRSILTTA